MTNSHLPKHSLARPNLLVSWLRILFFRAKANELKAIGNNHLFAGILMTWLVGMGRYWDDPQANWMQHLGLGSVIYIFALALLLWLIVKPLRPASWRYLEVVTLVSLTSPPAALYAIPVERYYDLPTSQSINAWFLAFVAAWRVALLLFFLKRFAQLSSDAVVIACLLPLTLIVVTLTQLNLERAVFQIMGGLRDATSNDGAYVVLLMLSGASFILFIPILLGYILLVLTARTEAQKKSSPEN
jgi:hypothetical protein